MVFNEPGVTRDRLYAEGWWAEHEFTVVDTGGIVFDDDPDEVFLREIRQQVMIALSEATVVLLVVDGKAGCTSLDEQVAAFLRKQSTPVVLAVNKCESTVNGELQAEKAAEILEKAATSPALGETLATIHVPSSRSSRLRASPPACARATRSARA